MSFLTVKGVEIKGVAACVPARVEENRNSSLVTSEEAEKYIATTGVERRHCAVHDGTICTSDLCFKAADKLLEELGWDRSEIGLLVFVSHTADYKLPATACILQDRLGLSKECMAFDVPLGCSGYVYGLGIAGNLVASGSIKKGLLLVGNTQSVYASPEDRSTALLFGDAGSATALEYISGSEETMDFHYMSDGSKKDILIVPDGGCRNPVSPDSFKMEDFEGGIRRTRLHETMDGAEVFMFAMSTVPKSLKKVIMNFSADFLQVDYLLLHQANKMLCEKIRKKLDLPEEKVPYNIKDYGNTSGATIPLLMVTGLRGELESRDLVLMLSGFGVGLSLGSAIIRTHKIVCPELLYI